MSLIQQLPSRQEWREIRRRNFNRFIRKNRNAVWVLFAMMVWSSLYFPCHASDVVDDENVGNNSTHVFDQWQCALHLSENLYDTYTSFENVVEQISPVRLVGDKFVTAAVRSNTGVSHRDYMLARTTIYSNDHSSDAKVVSVYSPTKKCFVTTDEKCLNGVEGNISVTVEEGTDVTTTIPGSTNTVNPLRHLLSIESTENMLATVRKQGKLSAHIPTAFSGYREFLVERIQTTRPSVLQHINSASTKLNSRAPADQLSSAKYVCIAQASVDDPTDTCSTSISQCATLYESTVSVTGIESASTASDLITSMESALVTTSFYLQAVTLCNLREFEQQSFLDAEFNFIDEMVSSVLTFLTSVKEAVEGRQEAFPTAVPCILSRLEVVKKHINSISTGELSTCVLENPDFGVCDILQKTSKPLLLNVPVGSTTPENVFTLPINYDSNGSPTISVFSDGLN